MNNEHKKITVVGAGNVGASCAQRIAERGYVDVVLMDIVEGLPQGKALDILQSGPLLGFSNSIIGTNSYQETTNSDITIITAGVTRKPGMSRDDLLLANMEIVKGVTDNIVNYSPDSIIIMVTNPLDAMAQLALRLSRFPKEPCDWDVRSPRYRQVQGLYRYGTQYFGQGYSSPRPRRAWRYYGPHPQAHHSIRDSDSRIPSRGEDQ